MPTNLVPSVRKRHFPFYASAINSWLPTKSQGVQIKSVALAENYTSIVKVVYHFDDPAEAYTIVPKYASRNFRAWNVPRNIRTIWQRVCLFCKSETHGGDRLECPWFQYEFHAPTFPPQRYDRFSPADLGPGQSLRSRKRKVIEGSRPPDSKLFDIRPRKRTREEMNDQEDS